ncbi:MAG TPA: hypothetical protein VN699_00055 [Pirellulales bacterium]|nr:hypothetical protein [Pirellulales bacterium]
MTPSLQALLAGAIDYAGMFPPASLDLEQSARNYFAYGAAPEAWMLGRFVCPASRLHELAPLVENHRRSHQNVPAGQAVVSRVAAVLRGGATQETWRENLRDELAIVRAIGGRLKVDVIEVRLPDDTVVGSSGDGPSRRLGPLLDDLAELQMLGIQVFVEPPAADTETRPRVVRGIVHALADWQAGQAASQGTIAFKLRTGGVTPQAFSSSAELAQAICALRDRGVFWKATAGLHHPLPRYDPEIGTSMHGFVNVLAAAALAGIHRLPEIAVQSILDDQRAGDFQFAGDALQWNELTASAEQIGAARLRSLVSFGSCSFDEPRDDLRALGWL